MSSGLEPSVWIVDTHLHYYPCYNQKAWLDSLFTNLVKHKLRITKKSDTDKKIFLAAVLTERHSENYYQQWKKQSSIEDYKVNFINNGGEYLEITSTDNEVIYIYPGQQFKSSEKIEVLSLGSSALSLNNLPLKEITSAIQKNNFIPVIPWSFGKWTGKRWNFLADYISYATPPLLLGDIYGRPKFCKSIFNLSKNFSFDIISGSDPLPLQGEEYFSAKKVSIFEITGASADNFISRLIDSILSNNSKIILNQELKPINWYQIIKRQIKLAINPFPTT